MTADPLRPPETDEEPWSPPAMKPDDPLGFWRGCLVALPIAAALWAVVAALWAVVAAVVAWLVSR